MYKVLDVARFVINYCNDKGYDISNLRLQKQLYFIQAYYLGIKNKSALFNEDFEAWDFGPVVPCVYQEFKSFGGNDIPKVTRYFENLTIVDYNENIISKSDRANICHVVELLKNVSTSKLVSITHGQTPWMDAYGLPNNIITKESIERYFAA